MNKIKWIGLLVVGALVLFLASPTLAADPGLGVSANPSSVAVGGEVSATISLSTTTYNTTANVISWILSYDSSRLEVLGVNGTDKWPSMVGKNIGTDSVKASSYIDPESPPSERSGPVAIVKFRGKSVGTANLILGDSKLWGSEAPSEGVVLSVSGVTVSITEADSKSDTSSSASSSASSEAAASVSAPAESTAPAPTPSQPTTKPRTATSTLSTGPEFSLTIAFFSGISASLGWFIINRKRSK